MACPLFLPASPLSGFSDLHDGRCAAERELPISSDTLRLCCNIGYARGVCERAAREEVDAIRVLVKANRGGTIEVAWSMERNHHPVAVGSVEVTGSASCDQPLERQARACAEAYLRQTGAAA
jgi:hypothetical protein